MNTFRLACTRGASLIEHRAMQHGAHAVRPFRPLVAARPRPLVCLAASQKTQQTQPKLTGAEKSALRTKSQQQNDSLVVVNCGAKGLSEPFLESLYDALQRNQLVKVRMGCSRQEKKDKEMDIAQRLDCVLIHSIGSTSIFFRQKGLSKPPGLAGSGGIEQEGSSGEDGTARKKSREDRIGEAKAAAAARPEEFKVVG
jgi:RNA-binding protein YhbY